ncbi:hypothetical protein Acr_24g0008490 [Actinidia rufa]|uniref:Uncharacterized protein n=1 Tax=Actinidia rufa TaxID=165716 RepID=A0A7J0GUY6_9ERIC|nr:hypothetical protein Acr_24g0008490 [Actinidia rufa]
MGSGYYMLNKVSWSWIPHEDGVFVQAKGSTSPSSEMGDNDLIEVGDMNICGGDMTLKPPTRDADVGYLGSSSSSVLMTRKEFLRSRDHGATQRCNKLLILTDLEDQRFKRVFRKLGLGGFFKVSSVLTSKTFERCFAPDRKGMAFNGRDNVEDKSVYGVAVVAGDEGNSSLSLGAMSESWLPFELRLDVEESKGVSTSAKSTLASKGVVIGEKLPRDEASDISPNEAKSKGKVAMPPPTKKKAKSLATPSATAIKGATPITALEKDSGGGNSSCRQGEVDKLSLNQVITKLFHIIGQAIILGASLAVRSKDVGNDSTFQIARVESAEMEMVQAQNQTIELKGLLAEFGEQEQKATEEHKENTVVVARLEAEVVELKKNEALTKRKVIEEFKSSDDF